MAKWVSELIQVVYVTNDSLHRGQCDKNNIQTFGLRLFMYYDGGFNHKSIIEPLTLILHVE